MVATCLEMRRVETKTVNPYWTLYGRASTVKPMFTISKNGCHCSRRMAFHLKQSTGFLTFLVHPTIRVLHGFDRL